MLSGNFGGGLRGAFGAEGISRGPSGRLLSELCGLSPYIGITDSEGAFDLMKSEGEGILIGAE